MPHSNQKKKAISMSNIQIINVIIMHTLESMCDLLFRQYRVVYMVMLLLELTQLQPANYN